MKTKSKYIVYLFPFLIWAVVYFYFSFDGLYGQDAYEYLRYTEALKTFLATEKFPGDYFWGVYYPILGCILSFIIPNTAVALQLISVLSLTITSMYLDKTIQLVYNENSVKNIPFLFFTLSPIVFIHSFLVMSDVLTCCFITISIYYLLLIMKTAKGKTFLLGIAFAVFAILTRYASAVILLPFCLIALIQIIKIKKYTFLFYSIYICALIAIPHVLIRSQNSLEFLSHQWLQTWNISNLFERTFTTVDGEMRNHYINLVYIFFSFFHPIFMLFGIAILLFFIKNKNFELLNDQKLLLVSIVLYAIFLGGIPFQNKRFLLLSFPLVIAILFPLIKNLFEVIKNWKILFIAILLIQLSLGYFYGKSFYERNTLERSIAKEMKAYERNTLYAFDIDIALKNRKLNFNYKSLWKEKHSVFEKNALLLVNEKQLKKQWKGKNPLINWENIKHNYQLEKLKNFDGDFNLYRIVNKK